MKHEYFIFPCRRCKAFVIGRRSWKTRRCPDCNHSNELRKVIQIRLFETWEEASDGLRLLKVPEHERKASVDGEGIPYRSSIWNERTGGSD